MTTVAPFDPNSAVRFLNELQDIADRQAILHWQRSRRLQNGYYALGIPVVIFSALVGSTVFGSLQKQTDVRIQVATGAASILAAILAALQTFLGFEQRAKKHQALAAEADSIVSAIKSLIVFLPQDSLKEQIDTLRGRVDAVIAERLPAIT